MNTHDIELPPIHYDELPDPDDSLPAMYAYARRCVEADRNRRGDAGATDMSNVKMPEPVAFRWRVPIVDSDGRQCGESSWRIGTEKGGHPWWTQDSLITTTQAEAYARAALQSQDREALTRLLAACPTTLHCDDFHHAKSDQHMSGAYCPPLARYLAAIDHARRVEGDGD